MRPVCAAGEVVFERWLTCPQRGAKRCQRCPRGGRSLRAKARRSLPPRERSVFERSGERSSVHASRSPVRRRRRSLKNAERRFGAVGRTRTGMGYPIRPSNVRVYQFHHDGTLTYLEGLLAGALAGGGAG